MNSVDLCLQVQSTQIWPPGRLVSISFFVDLHWHCCDTRTMDGLIVLRGQIRRQGKTRQAHAVYLTALVKFACFFSCFFFVFNCFYNAREKPTAEERKHTQEKYSKHPLEFRLVLCIESPDVN